jgi:hypothetical protein
MQFHLTATCISFFAIGILGLFFAASTRQYLDIWSFAAFCLFNGFYIWTFTPMFYNSFSSIHAESISRSLIVSGVIICASALTMSYFRLEGRRLSLNKQIAYNFFRSSFGIIFAATVAAVLVINVYHYAPPVTEQTSFNQIQSNVNRALVYVLITTQFLALIIGYNSLFKLKQKFKNEELVAQVILLNRRIWLSTLFTAGLLVMLFVFYQSFADVYTWGTGSIILVVSIVPAIAMFLMFFYMVSSANRFYMKFSPRLGQIDHEVMTLGSEALKKRYHGVIFAFDIAGMKSLNTLRGMREGFESLVDEFIGMIENDLSKLIQKNRITFKYKSNGDEFIFVLWARNLSDARHQFRDIMHNWIKQSSPMIHNWRSQLLQKMHKLNLSNEETTQLNLTIDNLDLHALACTLNNLKITLKGGIDHPTAHPDFLDPRYTKLSALFKPSKFNKVAVFMNDVELLSDVETQPSDDPTMGFISWSDQSQQAEKAS